MEKSENSENNLCPNCKIPMREWKGEKHCYACGYPQNSSNQEEPGCFKQFFNNFVFWLLFFLAMTIVGLLSEC